MPGHKPIPMVVSEPMPVDEDAEREQVAEALVEEALLGFGDFDPAERAMIEAMLITDLLVDPRYADLIKVAVLDARRSDRSDLVRRDGTVQVVQDAIEARSSGRARTKG